MRLDYQKLKALSNAIGELYRPLPIADLPKHLILTLGQVIPVEYMSYNDFAPHTGKVEITWDIAPPSFTRLLPLFERYMLENPLVPKLFNRESILPATRITDVISLKTFQNTQVYNEFYKKVDVNFQMACGIYTKTSAFLALALNRKESDFSDDEVFMLNILIPHVQQALEISYSLDAVTTSLASMMAVAQKEGRGVIYFNDEYRVYFISSIAEDLALTLFDCRPVIHRLLPAPLRNCVSKMKGNENSGIATVRAPLILSLADGSSVALKLALDPNRSTHCLTFEWERNFSRPEQLAPLGLTLRQNQVVYWVLHDKTNCEISIILGISFRTVDKHLEIIFNKLGVNNRAHLISKAWEVCCDSIHLQK